MMVSVHYSTMQAVFIHKDYPIYPTSCNKSKEILTENSGNPYHVVAFDLLHSITPIDDENDKDNKIVIGTKVMVSPVK